jgi:hypothetical protein
MKRKRTKQRCTYRSPSKHNGVASWQYLLKQSRPFLETHTLRIIWATTEVAITQVSTCPAILLESRPNIVSLTKVNRDHAVRVKLADFTPQPGPRYSNPKLIYSWTRTIGQVLNSILCSSFLSQWIVFPIGRTNKNLNKLKHAQWAQNENTTLKRLTHTMKTSICSPCLLISLRAAKKKKKKNNSKTIRVPKCNFQHVG